MIPASEVSNVNETQNTALPKFVTLAEAKYQKIWESLSETDKQLLENQASLRNLDTIESVKMFWNTRTLNEQLFKHKNSLNETKKPEVNSNQVLLINLMNRLK